MAEDKDKKEKESHKLKRIVVHDQVFYVDPTKDALNDAVEKLEWGHDFNSKEKLEALKDIAYKDSSKHRAPFMAKDHHYKITYRDGHFVIEFDKY